jgi:hypothetical protein
METQNLEPKNLEVLGNNQVSSTNIEKVIENSAPLKMGDSAVTTEADLERHKDLLNKFANNELTLADLDEGLSTTIYKDSSVKIPLFCISVLSSTTEEQVNAILTGESAIGKTHNVTETSWYFRAGDPNNIIEISDASPRSFIHQANATLVNEETLEPIDMTKKPEQGDSKEVWDNWYTLMRKSAYFLDLSNKTLIFLDIPNFKLLESLRTILAHDRQINKYLITDKNSKGMNRTKTVLIKGYFTAIFASASSQMDEQEISRCFLLSPTDDEEKIRKAIELQGKKKTDPNFMKWYETEPRRLGLRNRVQEIEKSGIKNIMFKDADMADLEQWFFKNIKTLTPKAMRDFKRLMALAEAWALLNFKHRGRTSNGLTIFANSTDIEVAKQIYEPMLRCIELGVTPEEFEVWKILEPNCNENSGLRIQEIHNLYYYEKKRQCSDSRLRDMLKNLVRAGLLKEEKEGVIIKYYPITHKETKQSDLTLSVMPLEKVSTNTFSSGVVHPPLSSPPTTL